MAKKYYQEFAVVGVIANTVLEVAGLTSPEGEKRTLVAVLISASTVQGNIVEGWLETERILTIRDNVLHTDLNAGATGYASTSRISRIEVGHEINIGQTFRIGIRSGAVANNIAGAYEYEVA